MEGICAFITVSVCVCACCVRTCRHSVHRVCAHTGMFTVNAENFIEIPVDPVSFSVVLIDWRQHQFATPSDAVVQTASRHGRRFRPATVRRPRGSVFSTRSANDRLLSGPAARTKTFDGRHWIDCRPSRTTADRHPTHVAPAIRSRREVTGRFQSQAGARVVPAKVSSSWSRGVAR